MRSIQKLRQMTAVQVMAAEGLADQEVLDDVGREHRETGERVTDIMIARGLVTEFDIARAMSRHLRLPYQNPSAYELSEDLKETVDLSTLHSHRLFPMDRFANVLVMATCGDVPAKTVAQIEKDTGCTVALYVALASQIQRMVQEHYPLGEIGAQVANRLDELFGG